MMLDEVRDPLIWRKQAWVVADPAKLEPRAAGGPAGPAQLKPRAAGAVGEALHPPEDDSQDRPRVSAAPS